MRDGRVGRKASRDRNFTGVGVTGCAGLEVGEDLVDHRRMGDERDDPHGPATRRTRERVDLNYLRQLRRKAAGGLGRREAWRGDDHGRWLKRDGLNLTSHPGLMSHPARTAGIPVVVPRRDVALVGDVHEHPGRNSSGSAVSVPADWPSDLSGRVRGASRTRNRPRGPRRPCARGIRSAAR